MPRVRLFVLSAVALFVELALIRYLGSEIRVFAYYKNLVLIACFLGFGMGFYRAAARSRFGVSLAVMIALVGVVGRWPSAWGYGPRAATSALSNFAGSLTMGEQNLVSAGDGVVLMGFFWALALFLACLVVMYGFAQQIGAEIERLGGSRRLEAYSWNVAGSLLGIAGFSFVSWLALGPMTWFAPAVLCCAPFFHAPRARGLVLASTPLVAFALVQPPNTVWSPYQRLETLQRNGGWVVSVNGTQYMSLHSMKVNETNANDRWHLPHTIRPHARNVLVIGAGGGNDVAAALQAGAERVVAVEIDPEIVKIGRAHHPDAPYADPRVHVVIDDARHYGETSNEPFDLIVFSHLDSHTALSGFTNVRLDNYIYTVESFRTFQRLLAPEGALYVSFYSTRRWVAERLRENLRRAFGSDPVPLYAPSFNRAHDSRAQRVVDTVVLNAQFVATASARVRAEALRIQASAFVPVTPAAVPPASTDDWPYLFVEQHEVPAPMLILALMLATISALFVGLQIRSELQSGGGFALDRQYFFLGAGFLLVEVHNVGKLARVFGTTWSVNAWVIAAVLCVILAANALVTRWPSLCPAPVAYAALLLCLVLCANVSVERLLALPFAPLLITIVYTSPLLFAGLIFADAFRSAAHPMRALGSNLLGSLLGGFLELASFAHGLSALLYIAAVLYALSYPLRSKAGVASSQGRAFDPQVSRP